MAISAKAQVLEMTLTADYAAFRASEVRGRGVFRAPSGNNGTAYVLGADAAGDPANVAVEGDIPVVWADLSTFQFKGTAGDKVVFLGVWA